MAKSKQRKGNLSYHPHKSRTSGQHSFATVPRAEIQRSVLNRNCGVKSTFGPAMLYPIFCDEALPGDTLTMDMSLYARINTLAAPVMENIYLDTFFFAVPNRILWENWERFQGAQDNPDDSTSYEVPEIVQDAAGADQNSLHDYMGIPPKVKDLVHSALFHRAYNRIYNDWFRDENLVDSVPQHVDDGPDPVDDYVLLNRGKRHDYFTSCLPWPQKADSTDLPLGLEAPVVPITDGAIPLWGADSEDGRSMGVRDGLQEVYFDGTIPTSDGFMHWDDPKLKVDLSSATAATINSLRQAFQIQRLYERDARGGTRYVEILKSHFGVTSPDFRMQRSEYLGGGITPMMINQVANTADDVGVLGAYGIASNSAIKFNKSFVEHCIIIGMICVRADLNYQQGLERQFSRSTRWDFYMPVLAHLGEQEVLNKEIYALGSDEGDPGDDDVFGYQERWAEYRYKPSQITGGMRSSHAVPLDAWHLAQDFDSLPVLNDEFIAEDPPIERIILYNNPVHMFRMDAWFQYRCARPMPTYSVPGMIDHF